MTNSKPYGGSLESGDRIGQEGAPARLTCTLHEIIAEVEREVELRKAVYAWVLKYESTPSEHIEREICLMQAALDRLKALNGDM